MANNYVLTSTKYPYDELTKEQVEAAIQAGREKIAEEEGWDDAEDVNVGNVELENDGIWFSHDESANTEAIAAIIFELQQLKADPKPFTFSYCYECSKRRLDEFGGGAYCITKDKIFFVDAYEEVEDKANGLSLCERGNTWLTGDDGGHYALFDIGHAELLEVSITPDNYPGFSVTRIQKTEEELAAHIKEHFAGWYARKCHIDGVEVDEGGQVIGE
jgi:hypothetical protein